MGIEMQNNTTSRVSGSQSQVADVVLGSETYELDIKLSELIIDQDYQRDFRATWANKIAREFDAKLFDKPLVSLRQDGRYAVIDGQHRVEALRLIHHTNDVYVRCDVVAKQLSQGEEAAKFAARNSFIVRATVFERFRARVVMGDPGALDILDIVQDCGFAFTATGFAGAGQIAGIGAIERIYTQSGRNTKSTQLEPGPVQLRKVLSLLRDAGYDERPLTAETITSTHLFLNRYASHPNFRRERLIGILRNTTSQDLSSDARSLSKTMKLNSGVAGASILVHRYNARLEDKNKLPAWS